MELPDGPPNRRDFLRTSAGAVAASGLNPLGTAATTAVAKSGVKVPAAFMQLMESTQSIRNIIDSGSGYGLFTNFVGRLKVPPAFEDESLALSKDETRELLSRYWTASEKDAVVRSKQLRQMLESKPEVIATRFGACLGRVHYKPMEAIEMLQAQAQVAAQALHMNLHELTRRQHALLAVEEAKADHFSKLIRESNESLPDTLPPLKRIRQMIKNNGEISTSVDMRYADAIRRGQDALVDQFSDLKLPFWAVQQIPFPGSGSAANFIDASQAGSEQLAKFWVREAKICVRERMPEFLTKGGMSLEDAHALVARHYQLFDSVIEQRYRKFMEKEKAEVAKPAIISDMPSYIGDDNSLLRYLQGKANWVDEVRNRDIPYIHRER